MTLTAIDPTNSPAGPGIKAIGPNAALNPPVHPAPATNIKTESITMKLTSTLTAALLIAASQIATADQKAGKKDIVDTAVAAGSFKTLAAALTAADEVMADPAFAAFGAMIDGASVTMRHAPVRWQMD